MVAPDELGLELPPQPERVAMSRIMLTHRAGNRESVLDKLIIIIYFLDTLATSDINPIDIIDLEQTAAVKTLVYAELIYLSFIYYLYVMKCFLEKYI